MTTTQDFPCQEDQVLTADGLCLTVDDGIPSDAVIVDDWCTAVNGTDWCEGTFAPVEIGEALVIEQPATPAPTVELARTGMNETLFVLAITLILCGGLFRLIYHFAKQGKRVLPWCVVVGLWASAVVVSIV